MKTIGYTRVSTSGQADNGISLEMQEKKLRAYCDFNDLELIEIIVDAGLSGKNMDGRPGMQRVLDMIKNKQVDAIVSYKLDRLGRSTRDLLDVALLCQKKGVTLHSLTEKLDTSSAIGKFFFTIIASLAELEREIIGERTKAAMGQKKANGQKISSRAPYGYTYIDNQAIPVAEEQACIEYLRSLRATTPGLGQKRAAKMLEQAGYVNRNGIRFGVSSMRVLWKLTTNSGVVAQKIVTEQCLTPK